MNKPLFWNPLPEAAKWLSEKTGRPFDARALINLIADSPETNRSRTIIKAVLPVNAEFAKINFGMAPPSKSGIKINQEKTQKLIDRFGKLPLNMYYISEVYALEMAFLFSDEPSARFEELMHHALLRLLLDGFLEIDVLTSTINLAKHELVCLMPLGTTHRATIETCGINRDDLIALGDRLVKASTPEPIQSGLRKDGLPKCWKTYCEKNAGKLWQDRIRDGFKPTKQWLANELAAQLRKNEYTTPSQNKRIDASYVSRRFVTGWQEP